MGTQAMYNIQKHLKAFRYRKDLLFCENVSVARIAKTVGTPLYIYSRKSFLDHYRLLHDNLRTVDPLICYSVKANSNITVLRNLVAAGSGLDIVSQGELLRAIYAGCDPEKIVFSGVGKTCEEIESGIRAGIGMFNIESAPELERIAGMAVRLKTIVQAALRVNPDVDPDTHHYIATGKKDTKFGIDMRVAENLYRQYRAHPYLALTGVHAHIGSQITKIGPFVRAAKKMENFIGRLRHEGILIRTMNIGGGLGIVYKDEKPHTAEDFARAMIPFVQRLGVKLILEPGRFIAGNAGIFVVGVEYIKKARHKNFIIVDGAMNDLIRPSLYEAYHEILPVRKKGGSILADVVGPVCESGDFLAKRRRLPRVKPGDLLACLSAGAYGFVMSSNYNTRPRVPEIMVDEGRFHVIRRREKLKDLLRAEL